LVQHSKRTLDSIRNLTELSQKKFSDKEFGELFYQSVTQDIGKTNLLLEVFLKYLLISTPIKKRDTVHRLIQEELEKHQVKLEGKGIKLSKKFERDLPETIVPDEPLRYILNSILQYGVNSVVPHGDMGFLTRSIILKGEESANQVILNEDGRYIEIKVFFTGPERSSERLGENIVFHQEEPLDLILQMVKEVVRKNRGLMKFETDEKKGKTLISIRFLSERREMVYYQTTHPLMS
jgi:hypothetical protein